jgi:ribulose-5-phosphate 4-epimerase/fuculose-1-phosphate aldolase
MNMKEKEGVIKYNLHHVKKPLPQDIDFSELNSWRTIMLRLDLIGQNPSRYEGLGFGNISQRLSTTKQSFIISGTQTGHLDPLSKNDFCIVQTADPKTNTIISEGPSKPSSEALTHASFYLEASKIQAIIHAHCPSIWKNTDKLKLPFTEKKIAYGTPEMAETVAQIINQQQLNSGGIFSMLGHEDGIVAFAPTFKQAAAYLINSLAESLVIEKTKILV